MRLYSPTGPRPSTKPLIDRTLLVVGSSVCLASLASLALLIDFAKARQDPETAIVVAVWMVAMLSALWLGASVLYWRQRLDVAGVGRGRLERFTMPGSKQIAKGLLAISLTVLPACGASNPSPPQLVHLGHADPSSTSTTSTTMTLTTIPPSSSAAPTSTVPPTTAVLPTTTVPPTTELDPEAPLTLPPSEVIETPEAEPSTEHTVATGDHLWSIAADETELRLGRAPTTTEVSEYWAKLITSNRTRLASGDPNMIYPGEILVLP